VGLDADGGPLKANAQGTRAAPGAADIKVALRDMPPPPVDQIRLMLSKIRKQMTRSRPVADKPHSR
jgi:hypothetical protein